MFSVRQKQEIAKAVEDVILSFNHPEMPSEKPEFAIRVIGKENYSWADIKPNWLFDENLRPSINPHNEAMDTRREII